MKMISEKKNLIHQPFTNAFSGENKNFSNMIPLCEIRCNNDSFIR